ncbi:MAG TPA: heat-inducible transcriptional repressor HrcA [Bacillota bacterium]|nr:heat-inducible transcriptional repressor HrcA [Bacillota bacterium]
MQLDDRKAQVLQAVIDDFIFTAEPVGSRTIAKKYDLGISSATIRNEMSDLEEMGYLDQLHTSSGRIPSDKAYRLYVDKLMENRTLKTHEAQDFKGVYETQLSQVGQVIYHTAKILSEITKYTSMVIAPQLNSTVIKHIQLVHVDRQLALLVISTSSGLLKDTLIAIPEGIDSDYLHRISNILNELYSGKTFDEIDVDDLKEVRSEIIRNGNIFDALIGALTENLTRSDQKKVYLEGTTKIFNFPEYQDLIRAKTFLSLLEEKDLLYAMLTSAEADGVTVSIGKENPFEELRDCSIVSATYKIGDRVLGSIGIIGPTRMEYSRTMSTMDYMAKALSQYLTSLYGK